MSKKHTKQKDRQQGNEKEKKYFHPQEMRDYHDLIIRSRGDIEHLSYKLNYFIKAEIRRDGGNKIEKIKFLFPDAEFEIHTQLSRTVKNMLDNRLQKIALLSDEYTVRVFKGKVLNQIVHGLGSAHVLETAITIHPVYGVPYIPGTSLKGIVRHYFIQTFFDGDENRLAENVKRNEKEEKLYKLYVDIFGKQDQQGAVNFLDVFFPSGNLKSDIMAVHYREYYNSAGKKPATDNHPPLPVNFYVLDSDEPVEFIFYLHKKHTFHSDFTHEEIAEITGDWLKGALTHMGLGSKTSRGYGRFTDVEEISDERIEAIKRQHEEAKKARLEKEREERKKREEEALLASMTEEERLVYLIRKLNPDQQSDQEKSKNELFKQVIATENVEAAKALKAYWMQTNLWVEKKKPKKKQELKVAQIKELLGE